MNSELMNDGADYVVKNGAQDGLLFRFAFGHARKFRNIEDFLHSRCTSDAISIDDAKFTLLPIGPPMPSAEARALSALLETSSSPDDIREAICRDLKGFGHEIGAGQRPTIVPDGCQVTYIDKFTFDEAKDGSFIGLDNKNFVKVSHFEEMEKLSCVEDHSSDFIVACHVIEHLPNVVLAISTACRKLKPGKPLFLVVPHKEYMFDRPRTITPVQHFISDFLATDPPMLEHYLEYARYCKLAQNWEKEGLEMLRRGSDFHAHVFTPDSMSELLSYLRDKQIFSSFEVTTPRRLDKLVEFYVRITS